MYWYSSEKIDVGQSRVQRKSVLQPAFGQAVATGLAAYYHYSQLSI